MVIFIKLLVSPEILYGSNALKNKIESNPEKSSSLTSLEVWTFDEVKTFKNKQDELLASKVYKNLSKIINSIEYLVLENKIFRVSDFDLQMLSRKINIPKSHLTYLYKYHCELFFPEFKKMLQIKDAEHLIDEGYLTENTLASLSTMVGFSSYNPFFIAFKKQTGLSPQNYTKKGPSITYHFSHEI